MDDDYLQKYGPHASLLKRQSYFPVCQVTETTLDQAKTLLPRRLGYGVAAMVSVLAGGQRLFMSTRNSGLELQTGRRGVASNGAKNRI